MQSNKGALISVVIAISGAAFAQQPPQFGQVPPSSHASTVEAMLVLDAQIALDKLRASAEKAAPPPTQVGPVAPPPPPPVVIQVLSILGIGDAKKATILIDGKRHSQLVVGSKAGAYSVRAVGGGCVDLVPLGKGGKATKGKSSKGLKHVCFDPDEQFESQPGAGAAQYAGSLGGGIQTRMTVAPLPLPVVPVPNAAARVSPM